MYMKQSFIFFLKNIKDPIFQVCMHGRQMDILSKVCFISNSALISGQYIECQ